MKIEKYILIKGYQHIFGRANNILEALLQIKEVIKDFKIVVFAANDEVLEFIENSNLKNLPNLIIKKRIPREEVLELMGQSLLYIGNSISDGTPNTLLEAIIMESFPIQSDPGGATAEIIKHGKNGFLIKDPLDSGYIAALIKKALEDPERLKEGIRYNTEHIKPTLERSYIQKQVLEKYKLVEQNL